MKTLYKALCKDTKLDVNKNMDLKEYKEFVKELAPSNKIDELREKIDLMEKAALGEAPFASALEDPKFVEIVNKMKQSKPAAEPADKNTLMDKLKKSKGKK